MNFTKEELQFISKCIYLSGEPKDRLYTSVVNKIKEGLESDSLVICSFHNPIIEYFKSLEKDQIIKFSNTEKFFFWEFNALNYDTETNEYSVCFTETNGGTSYRTINEIISYYNGMKISKSSLKAVENE